MNRPPGGLVDGLTDQRGARVLLVAACFVVVVFGLRAGAPVLLPVSLALFLAVLSLPLLTWLLAHRAPRWVAITLTMLVNVAVLGLLVLVVDQSLAQFRMSLPRYVDQFQRLSNLTVDWLEARRVPVSDWVSPGLISAQSIVDLVGSTLRGIASLVSSVFLVLLVMVFILAEATVFPAKLRLALGNVVMEPSRLGRMTHEVQQYLVIKTAVSLLTGVLIGLWVWMMGLDFPLFWGLIAFLFNYVPSIGSILASIPAILLALLQSGVGTALATAAGYMVVNMVLGNMVEPSLQGRRFGLSPLVVVLSLIFWGWVWGPVGMILSLPLTMIVRISLEHTEDLRWIAILLGGDPTERSPEG